MRFYNASLYPNRKMDWLVKVNTGMHSSSSPGQHIATMRTGRRDVRLAPLAVASGMDDEGRELYL
jgi:hypothetical protein